MLKVKFGLKIAKAGSPKNDFVAKAVVGGWGLERQVSADTVEKLGLKKLVFYPCVGLEGKVT